MTMRLRVVAVLALIGAVPTFGQVVPPPQAGRDKIEHRNRKRAVDLRDLR